MCSKVDGPCQLPCRRCRCVATATKPPQPYIYLNNGRLSFMLNMNEAETEFLEAPEVTTAHVLTVDDDPSVRQMIVDYLGDNDIRVTALASARNIEEVMARDMVDL